MATRRRCRHCREPLAFWSPRAGITEFVTAFNHQLRQQGSDCRTYAGLDWVVDRNTVVRPDVMVVCGEQPNGHLERSPSIVVEVLSPSTRELDPVTMRRIYHEHDVSFYLIADTTSRTIELVRVTIMNR